MLTYRIHLSRVFLSMWDVAAAALTRTEPHYSYHVSRMYNSVLQMYGVLKPVNTDNADRALQTHQRTPRASNQPFASQARCSHLLLKHEKHHEGLCAYQPALRVLKRRTDRADVMYVG
jgi:hypothetical protein